MTDGPIPYTGSTVCHCGQALAFAFNTPAGLVPYWCWRCDGHAAGCRNHRHVFGGCKVAKAP